jgi:hypothetical protein
VECRHCLCSFAGLERLAEAVRGHWGIGNGQHWVVDVQFGEDANRARKYHRAENLALARRMATNATKHNRPSKDSLRRRKLRASLNDGYRYELIFGSPPTWRGCPARHVLRNVTVMLTATDRQWNRPIPAEDSRKTISGKGRRWTSGIAANSESCKGICPTVRFACAMQGVASWPPTRCGGCAG